MKNYFTLLFIPFLAGCNSGTMISDHYDAKTGEHSRTIYSKYYDDGDWIIPDHLGMSVVVDHEKATIPVVGSVQRSIGALGPSDSDAQGKITVYIWNRDSKEHRVKILRVSDMRTLPGSSSNSVEPIEKEFVGIEGKRTGGEVGYIDIFNYGTEIPLRVEFEINGTAAVMELKLARRTLEEMERYFGSDGVPPYPWFHDNQDKG